MLAGEAEPGIVLADAADVEPAIEAFVEALGKHRHFLSRNRPRV